MTPRRNTWHKAGWVIQDPDTAIRDGIIHVSQGRVTAVKSGRPTGPDPIVDHGPGVLMPAVVNAHTHLELGALKGLVPSSDGFNVWVRHLIQARSNLDRDTILTGIQSGIDELIHTGCGVIGEIATLGLSQSPFYESSLDGIWFREYLGNTIDDTPDIANKEHISLAGHAPHTTSPELLTRLKNLTKRHGKPFSIHLSESDQEGEFIRSGQGAWADLLKERHIDFSAWPLPAKSPVAYLERLNIFDEKTLAVHLLHAEPQDLETLARHRTSVVVCPRSNQQLHQRLPDITAMAAAGLNLCLGTDSLASCPSLSIFDEMAATAGLFPSLPAESIFAMATINGTKALGLGADYGRLAPGYRYSSVYVPLTGAKPKSIIDAIVHAGTDQKVKYHLHE